MAQDTSDFRSTLSDLERRQTRDRAGLARGPLGAGMVGPTIAQYDPHCFQWLAGVLHEVVAQPGDRPKA
jgi:hypothetical protein